MTDLKKLNNEIEKLLNETGYKLFSLNYSEGSKEGALNIVIDKDAPISLDDIVEVSEKISAYLDKADPFEKPYTLDVSSLGAEKPVDVNNLLAYKGEYVNLHLTTPIKGENILEGTIESIDDSKLTLLFYVKGKKTTVEIPLQNVDKARLAIKF